jgi:hypothetical protein
VVAVLSVAATQAVSVPKGSGGQRPPVVLVQPTDPTAVMDQSVDSPEETSPAASNPPSPGPATTPPAPPATQPQPTPSPTPPPAPLPIRATTPARTPSPSAAPWPATAYEAEAAANTLTGSRVRGCTDCSGARKVGDVGRGTGRLRFNGVVARSGGRTAVTISYLNGESVRISQVSVNGAAPVTVRFPGTGGWSRPGSLTVTLMLTAGVNTITFFNDTGPAPDFDRLTVGAQ